MFRLLEKGFFHRVAKPEKREKRKKLKEGSSEKGLNKEEVKVSLMNNVCVCVCESVFHSNVEIDFAFKYVDLIFLK